jgi:HPt (histidine-containing phosphotransfer) domain-containing protein
MGDLSERGQAMQARLTQKFINSLPEKMQQIAACWHRLESGGWSEEDRQRLSVQAHRLSGSAGSYGLDSLGEAAARLNRALKAGTSSAPKRLLIAQRVRILLYLLQDAGRQND